MLGALQFHEEPAETVAGLPCQRERLAAKFAQNERLVARDLGQARDDTGDFLVARRGARLEGEDTCNGAQVGGGKRR